ncbi:chromodomain-helicase-DNA-binding protein 1 [Sugiyamaella lignohabitans]|uniref:Chromodomain-helicase-DNA-binding protein 1 n=1 Tax=Sugiyamaella lignohabitans TaxID=796027 RepID=A0A167EID4_9ASCO|nr:chromodomain-helicase-DNA-binding protein 1 [Sugiyamaella lignohabitans]ANB14121.1 chromodomain-helicase-DNA-binding protein 1 [Sugiyamaella lignohabitans]
MSVDFENDPELYGLRRSRRAHIPPEPFHIDEGTKRRVKSRYIESSGSENDDSDSGSSRKRSQKKKAKGTRGRPPSAATVASRAAYYEEDEDIDDDDEDDDDDDTFGGSTKKKHQHGSSKHRRKRAKLQAFAEDSDRFSSAELRFSTRNNKTVNYNIDDDDDDFEEQVTYQPHEVEDYAIEESVEAEPVDSIDQVLDHALLDEAANDDDPKKGLKYYVCQPHTHLAGDCIRPT